MIDLRRSDDFAHRLDRLRDRRAKSRIEIRLLRAAAGHLGDVRSVGDGGSEMRIDYGPGYRLYLAWRGKVAVVLLCGGDKGSQERDIISAKKLAARLEALS